MLLCWLECVWKPQSQGLLCLCHQLLLLPSHESDLFLMGAELWQVCTFGVSSCSSSAPLCARSGAGLDLLPVIEVEADRATWLNERLSTEWCLFIITTFYKAFSVTFSLLIHYCRPLAVFQISVIPYISVMEVFVWRVITLRMVSFLGQRCHRSKLSSHCNSKGN